MNTKLFDFVDEVRFSTSAEMAASALIDLTQECGAVVANTFFGTEYDHLFVGTLPDWYLAAQYEEIDIYQVYVAQAMRSGQSRALWGIDLDGVNPLANEHSHRYAQRRYDLFRQRSSMTLAMPNSDGTYDGAGIGIGFDESGDAFLKRIDRSGGALAVAAYAAFARMHVLRRPPKEPSPLSKRQAEILQHMAAGRRQSEIADRMGIGESAVHLYLGNLKKKLGVKTKEQALAQALIKGWIGV